MRIRVRALQYVLALLSWAVGSEVFADVLPVAGAQDPRIRVATYSGEQVYRLYGYVGFQIDLQFEPGETFVGLVLCRSVSERLHAA